MSGRWAISATPTPMTSPARSIAGAFYGDKIKTSYVENVPEGPDAERVLRQLAQEGNGLIFATSFGFMNATAKVAKSLPKVYFEHATGYMRGPNLATYNARFYEGRAVIGTIAGMMSKSGIGAMSPPSRSRRW